MPHPAAPPTHGILDAPPSPRGGSPRISAAPSRTYLGRWERRERVRRSVIAVALLSGLDAELEPVLRGRQRAGGERGEGARRVVGPVEVQHHLPVLGQVRVQEAARAVRLVPVGEISKDEEELILS